MTYKNKGHINKIWIALFGCSVHIVITEDPNYFVDKSGLRIWTSDSPDEDISKLADAICFQKAVSDYYIMMSPNVDINQSAHETVHCIGRIFRDRGIKADYDNDEIFAYYVGWLTEAVCNHLFRVKEEIKSVK